MWPYFLLFILVGCVAHERDFKELFRQQCKGELTHAPLKCGEDPFLPKLLQSKEDLVIMNFDFLANFVGYYTPEQLQVTSQEGVSLWELALEAGAENVYLRLIQVPELPIKNELVTEVYYKKAPRMFVGYKNFKNLLIEPSMELFLSGNGQNPHSLVPLSPHSKDVLLAHVHRGKSLEQIASLFYYTNVLRDADLVRDLSPYLHLNLPFPPEPEFTVSLGALISRKWMFQLKEEFFFENEAFFDPLALAIYEGVEVDAFLPFTSKSNALAVAYALGNDNQFRKIKQFEFHKIALIKPHVAFKKIKTAQVQAVKDQYYRGMSLESKSYRRLRSMILAIKEGDHNMELIRLFWSELENFIRSQGLYPAFNRFIGHDLRPIQDILLSYGYNIEILIPKFKKQLKKLDDFGEGSL